MFLDSLRGTHQKDLEVKCEELSSILKRRQIELEQKEQQIERLSKNIRKWTRKYNELELSISENVIDAFGAEESDHDDETRHLQMMLIKLNRRNEKLEKRLQKMSDLLEAKAEPESRANVADNARASLDPHDENFEPEFSAEFKAVLNQYADAVAHD